MTSAVQHIAMHEFEAVDEVAPLLADEVHLWLWQAPEGIPPRTVSTLAHAELRRLLQAYAGVETAPDITRGAHGKPLVAVAGFPHFNLSHAGRCIVFAFSSAVELGVDVDATARRHSPIELATRFFAAEETAALAALAAAEQGAAFMRLWTCKEAVLKALGHGISFGLDRLRFGFDESSMPGPLLEIAAEGGAPAEWQLRRFDPAPGYSGALAWRGPELRVRPFRLGGVQATA